MTQNGINLRLATMMRKYDVMNDKMDTLLSAVPVKKDARVALPQYTAAEIQQNKAGSTVSV
jgi:hypothetical protein